MPGIGFTILRGMEPDRGRWQGALTLNITTFSITIKNVTLSIVTFDATMSYVNCAECRFPECRYTECLGALGDGGGGVNNASSITAPLPFPISFKRGFNYELSLNNF
jgi:hypothetical protein